MARRGFFAELNYQAQQAEKRRRQQEAQMLRARSAAIREQERTLRAAAQAQAAAGRASEAQRKAAEKEAGRLHVEAQLAEAASMNEDLAKNYQDIDGLLAQSLNTDHYLDLETLKATVEHPPFDPGHLGVPLAMIPEPSYPPQPSYVEPPPPRGLSGGFGGKQRHQVAVATAQGNHQQQVQLWHEHNARLHADYVAAIDARNRGEAERVARVAEAYAAYEAECAHRESKAASHNERLSKFITDLAFDVEDAVDEFVGMVLENSHYPEVFPVEFEHAFNLATREMSIQVFIPAPSSLPSIREYRYVKATDEIVPTIHTARALKDRYGSAVHQVAIRTLHEVFDADRTGKVQSIALEVGVNRIAPSTGLPEYVPLVQVAAERRAFTTYDLSNIVPSATLEHLGAALSKSPFDLLPANTSRAVRQRAL